MKGDLPAAAYRLLATLPVRTHLRPMPRDHYNSGPRDDPSPLRKRIRIGDTVYDSITEARKAQKCSMGSIYKMLARMEATYV